LGLRQQLIDAARKLRQTMYVTHAADWPY
jgi:hypothetical protein